MPSPDRRSGPTREILADWELTPDGVGWQGSRTLLLPVTTSDGAPAVLKIGVPGAELPHEHLALQHWHGRGAVRLLRADPGRSALLLERLDRVDLGESWDVEACEIVARLYADLHVAPLPQLRPQASYVERRSDALRRDAREVPVPRRLVEQALTLAGDLCAEPATAVLHADLHFAHVLRGRRDDEDAWLAIAPRPANGDPHYELEPMLRHRFADYAGPGAGGSVREGVRRRFHTLVDVAGLDESRARDWVVVRSVLEAHRVHEEAARRGRALDAAARDHVTACISVAKAVQD